jgi:hypothetical protein
MGFHEVPWNSMRFYDVLVNRSVPTEANRGLTSYMIAPSKVIFYSREWKYLVTKSELARELTDITGIDGRVLKGDHPSVCSIADRMSWVSKRGTTREEDIAYSLLGIFNINMPLLYGKRGKAFIRLQEEIMKASDD